MQNSGALPTTRSVGGWMAVLTGIPAAVGRALALDLRSLALFRIGLGLLVMVDVGIAFTNVEAFYTDDGVLTRQALREKLWESPAQWSLHALGGGAGYEMVLLAVHFAAGAGLVAGWRTRWMNLACWVLACSLESRNPLITNGADSVMRLLLFWSLFLPLGAWWSRDAVRRRRAGDAAPTVRLVSFPAVCFALQVAFVYVFSALMKDRAAWFVEGAALQTALHLDLFALAPGVWLRDHAGLCRLLTRGSVWLELLGPLLLLAPAGRPVVRVILCGAFMLFHLGIGLCLNIGVFPWLMMVAWVALLPGAVWDRWASRDLKRPEQTMRTPPMLAAFCAICLGYVFLWNLRGTDFPRWEKYFPRSINAGAFALRLDQHWSMFAPHPTKEDGWFVLRAGLSDGTEVDLLRGGAPMEWGKPARLSSTFKDARWQKYLMNLWLQRYHEFRPAYGDWRVREWNRQQGGLSQVVAWQFYFVLEPTLEGGATGPVQRVLLAQCERVPAGAAKASGLSSCSSSTSCRPSFPSP